MKNEAFLKKIKHDLKLLEVLKDDSSLNTREKEKVGYSCFILSEVVKLFCRTSEIGETSAFRRVDLLRQEKEHADIYTDVIELIGDFASKEIIMGESGIKSVKLSDKEIEAIITEIMMFICDEELFVKFKDFFDFRRTQISYVNPKFDGHGGNFSIFVPAFNECYAVVRNGQTLETVNVLIHEIGHVLSFLLNFNYPSLNSEIFLEIPSKVFELLGLYFLSLNPKYQEFAHEMEVYEWNNFLKIARLCIKEVEFLDLVDYDDLDYISLRELRRLIASVNDRENKYQDFLQLNISSDLKYILGYLVGIEFVLEYKKNRDCGISKLRGLLTLENNVSMSSYLKHLLEIVVPGAHLEEYRSMLSQKSVETIGFSKKM